MGRLPRGLKTKMQASATGMSSPDWDQHDRLVGQLAADQDAALTEAFAPAPAGSSVGVTSRGRSQNRHSRVENNDDSSRSRSQSLNFPIRGWGAGRAGAQDERGKRWASQDSDTYQRGSRVDTDIEQERSRGIGESNPLDSSDVTGSGGGVDQVTDDENDLDERPSRSRSFFVGFGKWGIRRRREGSRAEMNSPRGRAGDDHMYSGNEGTMERVKGGSTAGADVGGQNMDGGGGSTRRRKGPSKRSENSRSRNNRFSSFTGEQPGGASSDAVEPGSASTLTPNLARKTSVKLRTAEDGRALRSHSMVDAHSPTVVPAPAQSARYLGGKSGWGRGKTTVRTKTEIEPKSRQRVLSAEAEPLAETPRNKTQAKSSRLMTPGRGRRGRSRAKSSAEVEDQEEGFGRRRRALSSATATATGEGNGAASSNSAINNSRSKSSSSTAPVTREAVTNEDGGAGGGKPKMGVFKRTRGVWESLQRSIGGGPSVRTSPEPSDGWRSRTPGRTRRQTPTPTPAEGTSAPISTVSSACNEKATEDAAAAERPARLLKAEEGAEAETRRQMQHKIVHLEMKLLVKEVVDMACLRAAEKASEQSNDRSRMPSNRSLLKIAPLSLSSSVAPEPLPRLSATALQPEQQTFFGKFWTSSAGGASTDLENADGGGGGFGGGRGGGGVAGHWGGPDGQGARLARRHSNVGLESETSAIWKGWGAQDSYHTENTGKDDVQEEKGEEEGFFQVLRRKIFEGDKEEPEKKPPQKAEAGGAQKRASPFRSNSTSEMPASLKITPVRPGAPPSAAVNDSLGLGGGGSGPRLRGRSRSMAGAGEARVRADSGRGSYSPLVNIPPLPQAAGTRSANHPDAAAGGICCIQSATSASSTVADSKMGPDGAEAAAAKFGLVRMDLSKS